MGIIVIPIIVTIVATFLKPFARFVGGWILETLAGYSLHCSSFPGLLYLINYRTLANYKKKTNGDCRWSYGLRMLMAYSKSLHN